MERDAEARGSPHDVADQADRLSWLLYERKARARDLIGGSNARILSDAATEIERLRADVAKLLNKPVQ